MLQPVTIIAGVFAILFLFFCGAALSTVRRRRYVRGAEYLLLALLMVSLAGLFAVTTVATWGYRALTHEEVAGVVEVRPAEKQRFVAQIRFPDGAVELYRLAGDEVYIDARILKWKPAVNILGLHTAYELDRIGGRYRDVDDEREQERTVFRLSQERPVDMFEMGRRYSFLKPLLDAEYGSATFVPADRPAVYEIRVSTTGLLARPMKDSEDLVE